MIPQVCGYIKQAKFKFLHNMVISKVKEVLPYEQEIIKLFETYSAE